MQVKLHTNRDISARGNVMCALTCWETVPWLLQMLALALSCAGCRSRGTWSPLFVSHRTAGCFSRLSFYTPHCQSNLLLRLSCRFLLQWHRTINHQLWCREFNGCKEALAMSVLMHKENPSQHEALAGQQCKQQAKVIAGQSNYCSTCRTSKCKVCSCRHCICSRWTFQRLVMKSACLPTRSLPATFGNPRISQRQTIAPPDRLDRIIYALPWVRAIIASSNLCLQINNTAMMYATHHSACIRLNIIPTWQHVVFTMFVRKDKYKGSSKAVYLTKTFCMPSLASIHTGCNMRRDPLGQKMKMRTSLWTTTNTS